MGSRRGGDKSERLLSDLVKGWEKHKSEFGCFAKKN